MSRVRVHDFSISIDGYGAGPHQSRKDPLGVGGEELHDWVVSTRSWQQVHGQDGGTSGIDDDFTSGSMKNLGAWIMGRNMFGAERGPWRDTDWKGWWGKNPPYHVPVFVLTHHPRESIAMEGGTTFHFVTSGIHEALDRARDAAGEKDIRIGGGAATIRQYLEARLIDEMHVAVSPILLGGGESLLSGLDLPALGYRCSEHTAGEKAVHYRIARAG